MLNCVVRSVEDKTKTSSAFRKEYRGRENLSRGTTSVRRHLAVTTFLGTDIPQFCDGNTRCLLLHVAVIQCTANRMNSRRIPPLPRTDRQLSLGSFQPTGFCSSHLSLLLYHVKVLKSIAFLEFFNYFSRSTKDLLALLLGFPVFGKRADSGNAAKT